jgi:hypothetical protein
MPHVAAIAPPGDDTLFFAGDIGQRIFQHPVSWKARGIEVRGRSSTLKVCYRTLRQIRSVADRLLPGALRDPDGNEEERTGTISVFDGPAPVIAVLADAAEERVAGFLRSAVADGIDPGEIGLFIRSPEVIGRARAASEASGHAEPDCGFRDASRERSGISRRRGDGLGSGYPPARIPHRRGGRRRRT